jgi:hypothetical protein
LGKANVRLSEVIYISEESSDSLQDRITKSQGMSNLLLVEKKVRENASKNGLHKPKAQWQALQFACQMEGKIPKSQILVQLYDTARTYFRGTGG